MMETNNTVVITTNTEEIKPSKKKLTKQEIISRVIIYGFLIILGVVFIFPYFFMVMRGLMTPARFNSHQAMWILPKKFMISNLYNAFASGGYALPLLNSVWLSFVIAIGGAFASAVAAYAFVRLEWIGKKVVFALMMATTMLPGVVTQVPLYVMYNMYGMLNTYFPLFLPGLLFPGAMSIFLTRQFMLSEPKEMYESAMIDGAGPFRSFISISFPLSKTIIIYLAVNAFMGAWGDYYAPSIFIKSVTPERRTFAYALYCNLLNDPNKDVHPEFVFTACIILSLVPLLCFAFFQKYLIQGVATAGIKG